MSVGFGFSVGDFITAIELVGTVIDALRSSSSASVEFRQLISQLLSLETALLHVKRLEFDESQYAEVIALRQAAAQCQRTIDGFWKKAVKYQPSLAGGNTESRKVREGWMKIKWAVCEKEDVTKFKADLVGHTQSIQLLLATVQMGKVNLHEKKECERQQTIAGRIQDGYFNCMQRLSFITDQGKQLLETTSNIFRLNIKVFQAVLQIQNFITNMPGQVERQQPVYLLDALGRHTPFHLEFVQSAEALVAVLRINFKKYGNGAEKIDKDEFAIQDSVMKQDVNLKADWDLCFTPGQRVDMSMIITRKEGQEEVLDCPKCHTSPAEEFSPVIATGAKVLDLECTSCGTTYRKIPPPPAKNTVNTLKTNQLNEEASRGVDIPESEAQIGETRVGDEECTQFKRVRYFYEKKLANMVGSSYTAYAIKPAYITSTSEVPRSGKPIKIRKVRSKPAFMYELDEFGKPIQGSKQSAKTPKARSSVAARSARKAQSDSASHNPPNDVKSARKAKSDSARNNEEDIAIRIRREMDPTGGPEIKLERRKSQASAGTAWKHNRPPSPLPSHRERSFSRISIAREHPSQYGIRPPNILRRGDVTANTYPLIPGNYSSENPSGYSSGPPLSASAYFQQASIPAPSYPPPSPSSSYMRYAATPQQEYFAPVPARQLAQRFGAIDPIQRTSSAYRVRDSPIHQQIQDAYEEGYASASAL